MEKVDPNGLEAMASWLEGREGTIKVELVRKGTGMRESLYVTHEWVEERNQ